MKNDVAIRDGLARTNHKLKAVCAVLFVALLVAVGLQFESSADARSAKLEDLMSNNAVSVNDSAGFAVFVREDGNLVIVHKSGKVIKTTDQPMAVRF